MKISELIEKLEQIKREHGDVDVYCWPYDGQVVPYSPVVTIVHSEKDNSLCVEIDGAPVID